MISLNGLRGFASFGFVALIWVGLTACSGAGLGPQERRANTADLVVWSPTVSDSGPTAGTTFTVSAQVRNDGEGASAATTLRYYLSTDATITTSDTEIATTAVAGLPASGTLSRSVDVTAPATAATYYYGACVDAVTDESDTTNNCSSSVIVTVREPEPNEPDEPDLVVAPPTVSDSSPTASATFTLSAMVRNDGEGASAATTLRYYRSSDAAITTSDTEVRKAAIAALAASRTSSESIDVTAPLTAGTYYYGACVDAVTDESDTTNNCSSSVIVTVREPEPDEPKLAPPTVSNSAPAAGTTFTLTVTVESPDADPAATMTLSIYRSTDATITTSDTLVGTVEAELVTSETSSQSTMLAASTTQGASYSGEVELSAPDTEGTYYYGACTDTDNCSGSVRIDVKSSLQTNVDLVVGSPAVSDDSPAPFVVFSLSVAVRNDGDGSSVATTLRYYRSTDATITTSDTEVGTDAVTGLASEGSSDQSVDLTAPSSPGTYYYGACVDAVADESDTSNNCSTSVPVNILVSEPQMQAQPDLEVGTPTVDDASPETGATITLSATVSNSGGGASEATTLRFYRSTEETITTTHTEVGTDDVGALTASGTSEGSISVTVPRSMGRYFYGACVDAVADESDTTNNCSAPVTVTVVAPQQPEGAPSVRIYSASSAVTEGMSARFGVTATPAPTANLDVYLSYVEYARAGDQTTYYTWPPPETKVTIIAGSSSTTLTVGTIDDSDPDGNSVIQAWVASGSGYTIDSDPFRRVAFVVVVDDDGPAGDSVLSITAVSTSVSEGTAVQFTVSANPAPTEAVTVGYRVSETGSTFAEALDPGWNPGTVTIGAGQSTATLSFDTVDDSTDEEDSEVEVTLRVDTYPDGVELGFPAEAYVTVLDDD